MLAYQFLTGEAFRREGGALVGVLNAGERFIPPSHSCVQEPFCRFSFSLGWGDDCRDRFLCGVRARQGWPYQRRLSRYKLRYFCFWFLIFCGRSRNIKLCWTFIEEIMSSVLLHTCVHVNIRMILQRWLGVLQLPHYAPLLGEPLWLRLYRT